MPAILLHAEILSTFKKHTDPFVPVFVAGELLVSRW
jgi:hypothetical protein